jgi:hypothetical protein
VGQREEDDVGLVGQALSVDLLEDEIAEPAEMRVDAGSAI